MLKLCYISVTYTYITSCLHPHSNSFSMSSNTKEVWFTLDEKHNYCNEDYQTRKRNNHSDRITVFYYRSITGVLNLRLANRGKGADFFFWGTYRIEGAFFVIFPFAVFLKLEGAREIHFLFGIARESNPFYKIRTLHISLPLIILLTSGSQVIVLIYLIISMPSGS